MGIHCSYSHSYWMYSKHFIFQKKLVQHKNGVNGCGRRRITWDLVVETILAEVIEKKNKILVHKSINNVGENKSSSGKILELIKTSVQHIKNSFLWNYQANILQIYEHVTKPLQKQKSIHQNMVGRFCKLYDTAEELQSGREWELQQLAL